MLRAILIGGPEDGEICERQQDHPHDTLPAQIQLASRLFEFRVIHTYQQRWLRTSNEKGVIWLTGRYQYLGYKWDGSVLFKQKRKR